MADYRLREFWLFLIIVTTLISLIVINPNTNNSGRRYTEKYDNDISDTQENALKIEDGHYIGVLNGLSDPADFYRIYLDRGDKMRMTFSKNTSRYCTLFFGFPVEDFPSEEFRLGDYYYPYRMNSVVYSVPQSSYYIIQTVFINFGHENITIGYEFSIEIEKFSQFIPITLLVSSIIAIIISTEPISMLKKLIISVECGYSLIIFALLLFLTLQPEFSIGIGLVTFFISRSILYRKYEGNDMENEEFDGKEGFNMFLSMTKALIIPLLLGLGLFFILGINFHWI